MKLITLLLCSFAPLGAQDCSFFPTFNASGDNPSGNGFDNRQLGCVTWTVGYESTGFSSFTLSFQSSVGALTPTSFGAYTGTTIFSSSSFGTNTTGGVATYSNLQAGTVVNTPWVRIDLASAMGTGTIRVFVFGWKTGATGGTGGGGGSGGSGCPNPCPVEGAGAAGSPPTGGPVYLGGTDGTDLRALSTDSSGHLNVNATVTPGGTQDVLLTGSGSLVTGQTAVTGSAVALATHAANGVCVKALIGNTISVYIGPSGITTSTGFELPPGQGWCGPLNNLNVVYVIASTTGASVTWTVTD